MPWRRYKTQPLLWLRKEVFNAVLPLRASTLHTSRSTGEEIVPPPTPRDAARQVGAMAAALRKEDSIRTRYTTWVTEAWRLLQWSEPTAKLFWEMLCMTHSGDMNVIEELPVAHVCLFLLLHLHPESMLCKVKFLKTRFSQTRFTTDEAMNPPARPESSHSTSPSGVLKGHQSPQSHFNGMGPGSVGHGGIENSTAPSLERIARLASRGLDDAHHLRFIRAHLWNIIRLLSHDPAICGSVAHSISTSIDSEQPAEDFVLSMDEIAGISYLVTGKVPTAISHLQVSPPAGWQTFGIFEAIMITVQRGGQDSSSIPAPWLHNVLNSLLTVNEEVYHAPSPPKTLSRSKSTDLTPPSIIPLTSRREETSPMPVMLNRMNRTTVIRYMNAETARLPLLDLYVNCCTKSYIYILAAVKHATVFGCTDCTIVIGATAGLVRVVECERVQLVSAARRLLVNNCIECLFPCFAAYAPVLFGDNRSCMFAPHNALYPDLAAHMRMAGLLDSSPPAANHWCHPVEAVSAGAMLHSSRMGSGNSASLSQLLLPPDVFFLIAVPYYTMEEGGTNKDAGEDEVSPISLPQKYSDALENREERIAELLEKLRNLLPSEDSASAEKAVKKYFTEWLVASGNVRQILDLIAM